MAGRDVEEDQLVGPLLLVARSNFDRIAGVAEIEKIRPLDDPAPVNVEARNDAVWRTWRPSRGNMVVPAWFEQALMYPEGPPMVNSLGKMPLVGGYLQ